MRRTHARLQRPEEMLGGLPPRTHGLGSSVAKNAREQAAETLALLMEEITLGGGPGASDRCSRDCSARAARYFIDLSLIATGDARLDGRES